MNLIMMLAEKHLERQSVKKVLKLCGFDNLDEYMKPLMDMQNEVAKQAVLKWIACNSVSGQAYELRVQVSATGMTYELKLANRSGSIYVTRIREAAKLNEKALHCWLPDTSYQTLNTDEIHRSIKRADAVNKINEDVQYAMAIWKKPE